MLLFMITFTAYFITAIICDRRFGIAIAMGMPLIMFLGILPGIGMMIAFVKQQEIEQLQEESDGYHMQEPQ